VGRNEILVEFWELTEVNNAISKMKPAELQQDLKSEVFLILCELPEEKLIALYDRKELKFYMVRIMLNLVQNKNNQFYKKYRNFTELNTKEDAILEENAPDLTKIVNKYFENLYWYQKEILRLYTYEFNKNAKKLSLSTGIPYMSIIRTLNKTKQELKNKINGDISSNSI
jgi:hypothetical protein